MAERLKAPFPYYGGKGLWADKVVEAMGEIDVYSEPFAGSMAVLLAGPARRREIVCDLDGFVANFWRAVRDDPEAVAYWAEWPTVHQDLTARHRWLVRWGSEERVAQRLMDDPDFYDAKVAGWWAWGKSNWVGSQWCHIEPPSDTRPVVDNSLRGGSGTGVQSGQAGDGPGDKRPFVSGGTVHGHGLQLQRAGDPGDTRPLVTGASLHGHGLQSQRVNDPGDTRPHIHGGQVATGQGLKARRDSRLHVTGNRIGDGRGLKANTDKRPHLRSGGGVGGQGIQAHRVGDIRPNVGGRGGSGGQGLQSTSGAGAGDTRLHLGRNGIGGQGKAIRTTDQRPHLRGKDGIGGPGLQSISGAREYAVLQGERWRPWMIALAERLERVIVLNRSWESAVTPTVLGYRANPRVGVFLDPPYSRAHGRSDLYVEQDADARAAEESMAWAIEHGDDYRIVYAGYTDLHEFPDTWRKEERRMTHAKRDEEGVRRSEALWYSPACVEVYEEQVDGLLRDIER